MINGEIADPGDIYFAYYVDGEITRSMPSQNTGYKLDTEKSECTNGVIPGWDYANWKFTADYTGYNATDYTRTRCNLYFVKETTVNTVLGTLTVTPLHQITVKVLVIVQPVKRMKRVYLPLKIAMAQVIITEVLLKIIMLNLPDTTGE